MELKLSKPDNLDEAASKSDVLYMTGIQKERFEDLSLYERLKGTHVINFDLLKNSKSGITIMHPLPRTDEIDREIDDYEGAAYFRQACQWWSYSNGNHCFINRLRIKTKNNSRRVDYDSFI